MLLRRPGAVLALLAAPVALIFGQSSSTITGLITDQTKLPIPDVRVVAVGAQNGVKQVTTSNGEGYYTLALLPPAEYKISAELDGFKRATSAVSVDAGATARLDLVLAPGDTKQVIEVKAEVGGLETQTGMISNTITEKEIEALPLAGRNVLELAMTLPGVSGDVGSDEAGVWQDVPTAGAGLSIAGGRTSSTAILADGANATSAGIGRSTVSFTPDTIQELQVITSTFSAKYGVSGGGVINMITKPGTDYLRGNLYWTHRNPFLNARQFNRPFPNLSRRNEVGFTFGGPIVIPKLYNGKKRTFFFLAIEPKRWFDEVDVYDRFPTMEERQGDFRNMYVAPGQRRPLLYQQVRCVPTPLDCQQLLPLHRPSSTAEYPLWSLDDPDRSKRGLVIPKAYLDPLAQKILQDVPLPNQPFDPQGRNYFGTRGVNGGSNRWNLNVDHGLTGANRMKVRYTEVPNLADRYRINKENLFFSLASDISVTRQVLLNDTHVLSPRIVNEFRANYTLLDSSRALPGDLSSRNYSEEKFGLPGPAGWGYPQFQTGFGNFGYTGSAPGTYVEHHYQITDDVSIVRGRHNISVGTDWRLMMLNLKSSGLKDLCCPTFNWDAAQTNSGNNNTPGGAGGVKFASFLMGVPNAVSLRGIVIPYYYRWKNGAAYFQDDWKVKPNLTLNLGVRWQYNSPRYEKFNRQAKVDLEDPVEVTRPNGDVVRLAFNYLYAGYNGRSRYLEPVHKRDFEPRFGFAWVPRLPGLRERRMVIRGGYGISHVPTTGRGRDPIPDFGVGSSGSWGYTRWTNNNPPPVTQGVAGGSYLINISRNQPLVRSNPGVLEIPSDGILCNNCPPRADTRVPGGALVLFASDNASPYVQTWNLTTEMQVGTEMVLRFTYMGQKGTHLYSPRVGVNNPDPILYQQLLDEGLDPNELVPDPFDRVDANGNPLTVTRVSLLRPIPTAGDISVAGLTNSKSIYHAGSVALERRYSRGLSMRFNYTWGKSLDSASDGDLTNSVNGNALFLWGATRLQDPENLKANRSVSNFDMRHRINLSMIWDLPFGNRRRFLAGGSRFTRMAASNWQMNVLASMFSGFPFSPYLGDGNAVPGGATGIERIRPDLILGVPLINPLWSKNVANDVPYFNPEAFGRPAYGHLGSAPRTLDYARIPWKQNFNASLIRDFYPWEQRRRYIQLRSEFYNVLNHTSFTTTGSDGESPNLFGGTPPQTRTGLSLAGQMPYLVGKGQASYPAGTREAILAQYYNQNFGKFWKDRNGAGRVVQFALKIFF